MILITGNITTEPAKNKRGHIAFTIQAPRPGKPAKGEKIQADIINIRLTGEAAATMAAFGQNGDKIAVYGECGVESYREPNNPERLQHRAIIISNRFEWIAEQAN